MSWTVPRARKWPPGLSALGRTAWALGMNRDQNDVAPDVILGSAVIRIPEAFLEVALAWQARSLGGEPIPVRVQQQRPSIAIALVTRL